MKKRISCIALALVLTLTMVFGNSNVSTNDVKAAEKQKTMKMPICCLNMIWGKCHILI